MAPNPRIEELRKRLEKEPASRLFAQLAEELRKEGELAEAIRVSREGLQKHPNYPSARMTLGRALMDSGDFAGAAAEFDAVVKAAPDNILASRFLAESYESLGDVPRALAQYRATLALAPGDKQVTAKLETLQGRPAPGAPPPPVAAPAVPAPPVRPAPSPAFAAPARPAVPPPAQPPAITLPRVTVPTPPPPAPRPVAAPPAAAAPPSPLPTPAPRPAFVAPPPPTPAPAPDPPPIPLVDADEEFELERSYEAPLPAATPVRSTAEEALAREFERQTVAASTPPPPMPSTAEPVFDETDIAGTTLPPLEASELMAAARKAAEAQRVSRFTELDDEREGEAAAPPPPVSSPEPARRPGLETLFRFSAFDGDTDAGVEEPEVLTPDLPVAQAPPPPPPVVVAPPPPPPRVVATPTPPPPPRPAPPAVSVAVPAPAPPAPAPVAPAPPPVEPPDIISSTMAELYFSQGHIDKAIDVYRKLLRGGPENDKARLRLLELETLDRKTREEAGGPSADERRAVLQRQIAGLEALLSVIERE